MTRRRLGAALLAGLVLALGLTSCVSTEEANQRRAERRAEAAERARSQASVALSLAPIAGEVQTVQLYERPDQTALPILTPTSPSLVLAFDLMAELGRPLSVYFYHADRQWRRDLLPGEYMEGFRRDDILDYTISRGTQVPYVHYRYTFPNDRIDFILSGNYIVRVTEQGDEEAVLFEAPFVVAEEGGGVNFVVDRVMVGGQGYPARQPIAFVQPPEPLSNDLFNFTTCFVQNGRFDGARCASDPLLSQAPQLEFYLRPELAFEPAPANYSLDLTELRVGPRIEGTDFSVTPYQVILEPDYARFSGDGAARLNGQTVIAGTFGAQANAATGGEYASVSFSLVPPEEQPFATDVFLVGSFNQWRTDPAYQMAWVPEAGRYELDVLLKQGRYEYRYHIPDPREQAQLRGALPALEDLYTALVYYRDHSRSTDRLISVQQAVQ